jgi:DnaK suppressor protein
MARLNALPYATYCIQCQREAERYGSIGGHDQDWGRLSDSGGGGEVEATLDDIELDVS